MNLLAHHALHAAALARVRSVSAEHVQAPSPRSRRCFPKPVTSLASLTSTAPGTLGRALRQPKAALDFYRRGVTLEVVHSAFVLALARRAFRAGDDNLEPYDA